MADLSLSLTSVVARTNLATDPAVVSMDDTAVDHDDPTGTRVGNFRATKSKRRPPSISLAGPATVAMDAPNGTLIGVFSTSTIAPVAPPFALSYAAATVSEASRVGNRLPAVTVTGGRAPFNFFMQVPDDGSALFDIDWDTGEPVIASPLAPGSYDLAVAAIDADGHIASATLYAAVVVTAFAGPQDIPTVIYYADPFAQFGATPQASVTAPGVSREPGATVNVLGIDPLTYDPAEKAFVFSGGANGAYLSFTGLAATFRNHAEDCKPLGYFEVSKVTSTAGVNDAFCWGTATTIQDMLCSDAGSDEIKWLHGDTTGTAASAGSSVGLATAGNVESVLFALDPAGYGALRVNGVGGAGWSKSGVPDGFINSTKVYGSNSDRMTWGRRTVGATVSTAKKLRLLIIASEPFTVHEQELLHAWAAANRGGPAVTPRARLNRAAYPRKIWSVDLTTAETAKYDPATGRGLNWRPLASPSNAAGADVWGANATQFNVDPDYAPLQSLFTPIVHTRGKLTLKMQKASASLKALIGSYAGGTSLQPGECYSSVGGYVHNRDSMMGRTYGLYSKRVRLAAGSWPALWSLPSSNLWPFGTEDDWQEGLPLRPYTVTFSKHKDDDMNSGDDSVKPQVAESIGDFVSAPHRWEWTHGPDVCRVYFDTYLVGELATTLSGHEPHYDIANQQIARPGKFGGHPGYTVAGVTPGNPTVIALNVSAGPHKLRVGDFVTVHSLAGTLGDSLNYLSGDLLAQTPTSLTVDIDSSGFPAWTSGGTAGLACPAVPDDIELYGAWVHKAALPSPSIISGTQDEITLWLAACASAPALYVQNAVNDYVCAMKSHTPTYRPYGAVANLWLQESSFLCYALHEDQGSRYDFRRNVTAAKVGSPTHAAFEGFTFSGSGQAIDTGYNPTVSETIGTGNGSTVTFSATLAAVPARSWPQIADRPQAVAIAAGSVIIFDNGAGQMGTAASALFSQPGNFGPGALGSVDYATGAVSVTFAVAPANGVPVKAYYHVPGKMNPKLSRLTFGLRDAPADNTPLGGTAYCRGDAKASGVMRLFNGVNLSAAQVTTDLTSGPVQGRAHGAGVASFNRSQPNLYGFLHGDPAWLPAYVSGNEGNWGGGYSLYDGGVNGASPVYGAGRRFEFSAGLPRTDDEEAIVAKLKTALYGTLNPNITV